MALLVPGACAHRESPIVASMAPAPPMRREPPPPVAAREPRRSVASQAENDEAVPEATVLPALDSSFITHPDPGDERFNEEEYNGPAVLPKTLAKSALAMALRLYDLKARDSGNFILSPYDLLRLLTMAQAGSNRGSTEEIGEVLQLEVPAPQVIAGVRQLQDGFSKNQDLLAGNAVLIAEDTGLSTDMKDKLVQAFGSRIERHRVDDIGRGAQSLMTGSEAAFSAQDKSSSVIWANLALNSSRLALLGSTRSVMKWECKRGKTALLAKRGEVSSFAPTGSVKTYEDDAYRVVQLPGKTSRFALLLIFPKNGKAGLKSAPPLMNMQAILDGLAPKDDIKLNLPVLSSVTAVNLTAAVRDMGMQSLFDSRKSELSNLGPVGNGLYAKDLLQGILFDMNESGVTWSAYSALKFNGSASKAKLRAVNKSLLMPFFFMLHDTEWRMPLMFGRIEAM